MAWIEWLVVSFAAVLAVGCGHRAAEPSVRAPPAMPVRTAASQIEIATLLADIVSQRACEALKDKFIGLPADGVATSGPSVGLTVTTGRWWIRDCSAIALNDLITLQLEGVGWSWVDKYKSGFSLQQYVYFEAKAQVAGRIDATYDPMTKIASIWFTPIAPATAAGKGLGAIETSADFWGGVLSVITLGGAASTADETARRQVDETVTSRFMDRLNQGFTITYDVRRDQFDSLLEPLPKGIAPLRPFKDKVGLVNEEFELHPRSGAYHVFGPFDRGLGVNVDFSIDQGGASYRADCSADLLKWFVPATGGVAPQLPPGAVGGVAAPGASSTKITMTQCRWYLTLYPANAQYTRGAVRVRAQPLKLLLSDGP